MKIRIFDLTRQYQILKDQLEPAVEAQMAGGSFIMGDAVHKFEESFAAYIGVKHAIALNSGTDALLISLRALGIGPGDEVITTPFTFFATVEPIVNVGATPVFADVNPDTYNIDPASIERKISSRTKAILPVHIFGQPAQMDEILRIAKQYGLKVIEDACQAVGSEFGGKKAGSLGDVGCFSFFPTKNLGAFGDGGMITTNDDRTETLCRAYLQHGMGQNGAKALSYLTGAPDELEGTAAPTGLYNPYKYFNYLVGYNSRLDALQELGDPLVALRLERVLLLDDLAVADLLLRHFLAEPGFDFAAPLVGNGLHLDLACETHFPATNRCLSVAYNRE